MQYVVLYTDSIAELDPPEVIERVCEDKASCRPDELVEFEILIIPAKPPRLVTLTVALPVDPTLTWTEPAEERPKSWTFTVVVIEWIIEPLVALRETE